MSKKTKNADEAFEIVDLLFKAHKDGRVDKEETMLILQALFSEEIDDEARMMIKYICLYRDKSEFDKAWAEEPLHVSPKSHHYD